jgi:penicillin-binding protein 1A
VALATGAEESMRQEEPLRGEDREDREERDEVKEQAEADVKAEENVEVKAEDKLDEQEDEQKAKVEGAADEAEAADKPDVRVEAPRDRLPTHHRTNEEKWGDALDHRIAPLIDEVDVVEYCGRDIEE